MTVAVACNLPEGVILGVDSAVTLPGPSGVEKVYENAQKLFQLGNRPIGLAIFGLGSFGSRNLGSFVHEFEITDPDGVLGGQGPLADVVESLRKFFMHRYAQEVIPLVEKGQGKPFSEIPKEQVPLLGLVIGGFSSNAYLPEVWLINLPFHSTPGSAECQRAQGDFGTNWFAQFGPILRYVKGYDPLLIDEVVQYCQALLGRQLVQPELDTFSGIIARHEYPIPFPAMPLEEGIAHTRFLVELVINHHRFAVGAPTVGGKARIGMVTYKGGRFQILGSNG